VTPEDARTSAERYVIIACAGAAAARRSLRGSSPGWVRCRTRDEVKAFHESGHIVAAARLGLFCRAASIVPARGVGGIALITSKPAAGHDTAEPAIAAAAVLREPENDIATAVRLCSLLASERYWRSILLTARALRGEAERMIEKDWRVVTAVADVLLQRLVISGNDCERFLERIRPAPASAQTLVP